MKIDDLSYEETLVQLESILKELEGEDSTLTESIDNFKKGVLLYNHCNKLLAKAEGDIKIVLRDNNGDITDEEFLVEG